MEPTKNLIEYYLPPHEGFVLESLIATTYTADFEFIEEDLLAVALEVCSPTSRDKPFRSELERKLQKVEVTVLYDLSGCDRLVRTSPRIDAIPIVNQKLHSKISLLMWVREDCLGEGKPDRRMRLIVGSANLTSQGFRKNYECVVALNFGGKTTPPKSLLVKAINLVKQIAGESKSLQLKKQLGAFITQADLLPDGTQEINAPFALVSAKEVVPTIQELWSKISIKVPETVIVVSPFWTEGTTAVEALSDLFQKLGPPANLELVCRGGKSHNGKTWLPIFDRNLAFELQKRLNSKVFLRATISETLDDFLISNSVDSGDETEDTKIADRIKKKSSTDSHRDLHAKLVFVDGPAGSILYVGSSNCTRRGMSLGGPTNSEAGFIYCLTPHQRKQCKDLLKFAGPLIEVTVGCNLKTVQPKVEEELKAPTFITEIIAIESTIQINFREAIPNDLILLMPLPHNGNHYWIIFQADPLQKNSLIETITKDLKDCLMCDKQLELLQVPSSTSQFQPNVYVEVKWQNESAKFPVRFDDKNQLPLVLTGRNLTEGELLEYYSSGKEPDVWQGESQAYVDTNEAKKSESPIDTSGILAYFIRRFVMALPGIEQEIVRARYSRASLESVLGGPTSPLKLAERAFESLNFPSNKNGPKKSPTAVGFQVTEIIALLLRLKGTTSEDELKKCFDPVILRCRVLLEILVKKHTELQAKGFTYYQKRILEVFNKTIT